MTVFHSAISAEDQQQGTELHRPAIPAGDWQQATEPHCAAIPEGRQHCTGNIATWAMSQWAMSVKGKLLPWHAFDGVFFNNLGRTLDLIASASPPVAGTGGRTASHCKAPTATTRIQGKQPTRLQGSHQQGAEAVHNTMPAGTQHRVRESLHTSAMPAGGLQQQQQQQFAVPSHSAMLAGGQQHCSESISRTMTGSGEHYHNSVGTALIHNVCWLCLGSMLRWVPQ